MSEREPTSETTSAAEPAPEPTVHRRDLIAGAAGAAAAAALRPLVPDEVVAQEASVVPDDPTKVPGAPPGFLGERSPFERPVREPVGVVVSRTPLHQLDGLITPSDLHYERHHGGIPTIDPDRYELLVHGMVDRPLVFSLDELKRFPSTTRICFLECSGNFRTNAAEDTTTQTLCGLTSQSEWMGVPMSVIMEEVGVHPEATWFLAEGQDAAVMTRSIPVEDARRESFLAYAQNGEALRPANGYPVRLLNPGWEGNSSVKWLRRIEFSDRPFMTREETSKYTEGIKGGVARQFSFAMDARSVITRPSFPASIEPGWHEVRGIAWSGRGRIDRLELSFDEGRTWTRADLQGPVLPKAHTRFRYLWNWDGSEATILSRATDETGFVQPTIAEWVEARGRESGPYHRNPITGVRIKPSGEVVYRTEAW